MPICSRYLIALANRFDHVAGIAWQFECVKFFARKPARIDRVALLLCFCSLLSNALVAARIFENIPHLEDEMAYIWQAETVARGQIRVPSPPSPGSFMVPFVVDYQGWRFAKYPLGFPVLLSFGIQLGLRRTLKMAEDSVV